MHRNIISGGAQYIFLYKCIYYYIKLIYTSTILILINQNNILIYMKYVLNAFNCIIICDYLCIVTLLLFSGGGRYIFLYKCIYYYIKLIYTSTILILINQNNILIYMKYVLNASNCIIICDYLCIVTLLLFSGGVQYIFLHKCIYYYIKLIYTSAILILINQNNILIYMKYVLNASNCIIICDYLRRRPIHIFV